MPARFLRSPIALLLALPIFIGSMPPAWAHVDSPGSEVAVAAPLAVPTAAARPYRVAIQVGHYKINEMPPQLDNFSDNTGTSGGGRKEVDLNLDVSNRVARLLRAQGILVEVLPATVPSGYSADAFIAIHADGNASSSPRGFKISTRWSSEVAAQDVRLVDLLTSSYRSATGLPEDSAVTRNMRGYYAYSPRRANYRVSLFTPGAIVEMGYMTNAADRAVMFNSTDKVANGIANGIVAYLKAAYGTPATTQAYGYGYGIVDDKIDPLATPIPTPRPGSSNFNGGQQPQTGNWDIVLMGRPTTSIYTGAGGVGPIIAKLPTGQTLHATVRKGDYYQVTLPDGRKGWVNRNSIVVQL